MKVTSVVMLLLSSAEASYRLGDFLKDKIDDKIVKPEEAEPEEIPSEPIPFLVGGFVKPTGCADVAKFCDISAHGDLGWLYCYSAQKAIAAALGGWGIGGYAYLSQTKSGAVSAINIESKSKGGALAFNFAGGVTESEAGIDITAESYETTEDKDPDPEYAAALGLGKAKTQPYGLATAAGLNTVKVGSKSFGSNEISVKGKVITKFRAILSGSFGLFKSTSGGTAQKAANKLAAAAYTQVLVNAAEEWKDKYIIKEDKDTVVKNAKVVAEAFGETFASAIANLVVRYRIVVRLRYRQGVPELVVRDNARPRGLATTDCSDEDGRTDKKD